MSKKPSWRDFYDIHPAAAFFHDPSTKERLKELRTDIDKQQRIFDAVHTASVPGELKPVVVDGVSRLDAMESFGWEIVDAKGNWKGVLANTPGSRPMVVNHPGCSHEQVWDLVVSLNLKRRHYNESRRRNSE